MREKMFKVLRKWAASQGPGNSQTHKMSTQTSRCLPWESRGDPAQILSPTCSLHAFTPTEQSGRQTAPLPHIHGPTSPRRGSDPRLPHSPTQTPPVRASVCAVGPSEAQAGGGGGWGGDWLASSLWLCHLHPSKPPSLPIRPRALLHRKEFFSPCFTDCFLLCPYSVPCFSFHLPGSLSCSAKPWAQPPPPGPAPPLQGNISRSSETPKSFSPFFPAPHTYPHSPDSKTTPAGESSSQPPNLASPLHLPQVHHLKDTHTYKTQWAKQIIF